MATQTQVNKFIEDMSKLVIAECNKRKKKVLPSVCIAQSALETGWGTAGIMTKANGYFGIKATKSWDGKVYNLRTKECYDGVNYTTITDCFRAYDNVADSIADYYDLITGLDRYQKAVGLTDARACITAIREGGYATSPTYVKDIMAIINWKDLTKYDACMKNTEKVESSQNPDNDSSKPQSKRFKIEVTTTAINVRTGPSVKNKVVNWVQKGQVHTVSEVSGNWGKISRGWIYLKGYTKVL